MTSSQSGGFSYLPRLGLSLPLRIFNAVLFPIPLVPTRPRTWPGRGVGSRWSLKLFAEYRWVTWVSRLVGRLMMVMASKGHFLGQIPHPMQRLSEMKAIFESGLTSMQSFPLRTTCQVYNKLSTQWGVKKEKGIYTGQDLLHSCRHFYRM